jgi:light-regulated signal transduction histidine kinase (bacteriophytochrome)
MKIIDIVNKDIVNLENCEQEPIHIPGSIQPHGFLIGLTEDYTVEYCSENTAEYTGIGYSVLLGRKFNDAFGIENEKALRKYISDNLVLSSTPLTLEINDQKFLCTVHNSGDICVVEGEPYLGEEKSLPDTYEQTRLFLKYMSETTSLQALCQAVANGTRDITGYDRVMIYRFDEEYNGEVFAESKREDLEPFLGLHYPHTDIPVQARALYMRNLLRLLGDINYTPVPIYTIDNKENKNLDLSLSILRSTSPIHVQYLQNMGVGATLTISLIHNNRLWGLIACHHYSAKNLTHPVRIAAQLQGHFITSQIDVRQGNEEYEITRKTNDALEKLLSLKLTSTAESYNEIITNPQLLDICHATGVCMYIGGKLFTAGKTPDETSLKTIIKTLSKKGKYRPYHTTKLAELIENGEQYCDSAAGAIYHSLSLTTDDCIVWLRGETITEVNWAGEPAKAIIKDEKGLHPRKSFHLWKEIVKCKSRAWASAELNAAATYAHTLHKHVTYLTLAIEEEKYRKLSIVLKQNNEELENVNWISTHDLQEPLRKIQMMASRILGANDGISEKNHGLVEKMNDSAHRMHVLLKDILAYSKVRNTESLFSPVDLNEQAREAVADLSEVIADTNAEVEVQELPEIQGISFLVKQLFTNLLANSMKFSDATRKQSISIFAEKVTESFEGLEPDKQYHKITISDTGIGFEQKFAESIFKIFNRLHNREEYDGSGVGLALCRKIMQTHNGHIAAIGKPGEGAAFELYFPVVQ